MRKYFKIIILLILFIFLVNIGRAESKSPAKAFMFSLIVPGSGQYYLNSRTRGEIYITEEMIGWLAYFYTDYTSNWRIEHYKSYADQHFNYSDNDPGKKSYTEMWHLLKERVYASENLPYEKEGEYYELIGKLDALEMFWESPEQQDYYYNLRQDANRVYKTRNMILGGILVNHIVSAVDALIQAKGLNIKLKSGMNMKKNEIRIGIIKKF